MAVLTVLIVILVVVCFLQARWIDELEREAEVLRVKLIGERKDD